MKNKINHFAADCRAYVLSIAVDEWNQVLYLLYLDGIEMQNFFGKRLCFSGGSFSDYHCLLVNKLS